MKRNILFCTYAEKTFGSESALFDLAKGLEARVNVFVTFPTENDAEVYFRKGGLQTIIYDPRKMNCWQRIGKFRKIVKENRIDVGVVNYHQDLSLFFWPMKLSRIPLFVYLRMTGGFTIRELIYFNFVNAIICVSNCVKQNLVNATRVKGLLRCFSRRAEVVYDGRELNGGKWKGGSRKLRDEFMLSDTEFLIGIIGAIAPRKRQDLFVEIANEVLKTNRNTCFFIVGGLYGERHERYKAHIENLIKQYNLIDNVRMIGRRSDIPEVMASLDLLLMLSNQEAFGGVVVESLICGTPVVARAIEGPSELVRDKMDGLLVEGENPKEYASKILELIQDRSRYSLMKERAIKGSKRFDIANTVDELMRIINKY